MVANPSELGRNKGMQEELSKKLYNKKIKEIGRIIVPEHFDKSVPFDDYDGEVYLKFNDEILIIKPYPTIEGDKLILYNNQLFDKGNSKFYSFSNLFKRYLNKKLKLIKFISNEELLVKLSFYFEDSTKMCVFLKDSDEVSIE